MTQTFYLKFNVQTAVFGCLFFFAFPTFYLNCSEKKKYTKVIESYNCNLSFGCELVIQFM